MSLEDENNNNDKQQRTDKINRPSVKTVKKWETELHINLRHEFDDDGNVKTITCKDFSEFLPDQTSTVC